MENNTIVWEKTDIILAILQEKERFFKEYSLSFYELDCIINLLKQKAAMRKLNLQITDTIDKKYLEINKDIRFKNMDYSYIPMSLDVFKGINVKLLLEAKQIMLNDLWKIYGSSRESFDSRRTLPELAIPKRTLPDLPLPEPLSAEEWEKKREEVKKALREADRIVDEETNGIFKEPLDSSNVKRFSLFGKRKKN